MSNSFYSILEVTDTATPEEIKKSYRKLSMLYHPDKNGNSQESTEKFQKINEAYEVLSDPERKREYDMTQNNPFIKMMSGQHGSPSGMNPVDELFSNIFGMPFMGMNMGMNMGMGPDMPFGPNVRVFHNGRPMQPGFGNMPQGFVNMQQGFGEKPTPIIKNITVPIDKILTGTTIPVDIERWLVQNGTKIFENETVYVTVPKGIDEGEIILLKEKGNIINDTNKGDIKIFIKIENNTEFKRSGLDLILEKTITVKEALCGFSFELKYISGKIYTITNNSGNIISNGYKKLIPNMGFSREDHTGNLLIIFNVNFPEKLPDDVLAALKAINF